MAKMAKMTTSSMLHVRVDDETKARASETLEAMGLTMSQAIKLFLHRVVEDQRLPFELKVPNANTQAAMLEAEEIVKIRRARFASSEELFVSLEENSAE